MIEDIELRYARVPRPTKTASTFEDMYALEQQQQDSPTTVQLQYRCKVADIWTLWRMVNTEEEEPT